QCRVNQANRAHQGERIGDIPRVIPSPLEWAGRRAPRIGHENVETAESRDCLRDDAFDLGRSRHVGSGTADRPNLRGSPLDLRYIARAYEYARAFVRQGFCTGFAESPARPRNECPAILQPKIHSRVSVLLSLSVPSAAQSRS